MRKGILFIFLIFINECFSAHQICLPKPTGPYGIGTKAIEVVNPSKQMFHDSSAPDRFMVQLYYPSSSSKNKCPYMFGTIDNGIVENTKVLAWSCPNTPIATNKKFPLVIFIPGLGGMRQQYSILLEELASHGYIILSIDQPNVSNFVVFPDGTKKVFTFKDAWNIPRNRNYKYQYYDDAMAYVMDNITYLLDHFKDFNHNNLKDAVHENAIILMGHSFGGNVASTLGFKDPRIKAVVDIDSKITEKKIFARLGPPPNISKKPVLFIRGDMQYQEDVGDLLTKIAHATIWKPYVQHSAFSDNAYLAATIPNFKSHNFIYQLFRWFFKRGAFWDNVDTNLGGKDVNGWYQEYRNTIINWLQKNIKDNK